MSVTRQYVVTGMHCNHCASSVTEEVSSVSGVSEVKVDVNSGQLIVISDADIPFENIEAAVDEAGYSVATA
jgi:copper chaperone CopZ